LSVPPSLVPELYVTNLGTSLEFYVGRLGFSVIYERLAEGFAYVRREHADLMLEEPTGRTWLKGPLERPFGRGINLQITCKDVSGLYGTLSGDPAIVLPVERRRYDRADDTVVVAQFVIADPDGYLLRFSQAIGIEALTPARPRASP
jgi:catechol 2,3-dioxygenase-like lactoylglutathione lyase family enzyme